MGGGLNTGKMAFTLQLHKSRAQHRDNGGSPSSRSHTTQFLSICLWHLPSHSPSAEDHGACLQVRKSVASHSLRGCQGFQPPSVSPGWVESSLILTARYCTGSSFRHWCSGLETPVWGYDPSLFIRDLCRWDICPDSRPY